MAKFIALNKNIKIFLNYFLGPILFIWLSFSIYNHVIHQPNWYASWQKIKLSLYGPQSFKVIAVIVLMFLNWSIEALKWKIVVKHIEDISFITAFKGILAGVSLAINTPNRIGEYFGRMIYLSEGNRLRAITLTVVGSTSQLIITVIFGIIGLFFLRQNLVDTTNGAIGLSMLWINIIIYGASGIALILLLIYFRLGFLTRLIEKIPFVAKYVYFIQKLEEFEWPELLKVLILSLLRYGVFIIQYVLLLQVFGVEISLLNACLLTFVMFLILAVVPTIALAELGLRGQVGLLLFGLFSNNSLGIVLTASGIWIINLVVPALAGSLFILGKKFFRNK
ncbi:MAG: flippase-like domain-containing protein [Chitinophagaceae bacterium]|nr:flippase-like domain-containing protein [Chitinophagaceae bacterium]